jgi:hypothetical protein
VTRPHRLNQTQLRVLRWISDGAPGEATNGDRISARSLAARGVVRIKGRGTNWRATITEAGTYYLENDRMPPGLMPEAEQPKKALTPVDNDWEVESPRAKRERGRRPRGDGLFSGDRHDPFDEKILMTVKEAAWLLSLPEGAIRRAVVDRDIDRVFIGEGTTNYRVVYGSLLAWVNEMPREGPGRPWWS